MTAMLRIAASLAAALVAWLVIAAQLPSHVRLPLSGIVAGAVVSQPFGCTALRLEPYDPFCPGKHVHTGIDLAAPVGTEVRTATAGTANLGFDPNGAGLYVVVTADAHVRIFYCHLSGFRVLGGVAVQPGEIIGLVGSTGLATGPHVHFEVQVDGTPVDPAAWLSS
jgi:murein DD-endopeptidase MepM/ murein hydrolase activator NlpD